MVWSQKPLYICCTTDSKLKVCTKEQPIIVKHFFFQVKSVF